jgi:hypothetical protein
VPDTVHLLQKREIAVKKEDYLCPSKPKKDIKPHKSTGKMTLIRLLLVFF